LASFYRQKILDLKTVSKFLQKIYFILDGGKMRFLKALSVVIILTILAGSLISEDQKFSAQDKATFKGAKIHRRDERYEKALPMFEELLIKYPSNLQVLYNISLCHYFNEDYIEANNFFNKLIEETNPIIDEINSKNADDSKKADKEIKKFYKDIDKNFSLEKIQQFKTSIYQKLYQNIYNTYKDENYDEVISQTSELLEITPDSSKVYIFILKSYEMKEDSINVLKTRIKIAELEPENFDLKMQIANNYYNDGDYENALEWYQKALELDTLNIDSQYNIALCYKNLDNKEQAFKEFEKYIELDPQGLDIIIETYYLARSLDKTDDAMKYLIIAHQLVPERTDILSDICYYLNSKEKWIELLAYAEKLLVVNSSSKEAQQFINIAKQKLNK